MLTANPLEPGRYLNQDFLVNLWVLRNHLKLYNYTSSNSAKKSSTGFEKPSAIQQRAIRPIVIGRDVIAQAQSGTGKTATFAIAILQALDISVRETQVLTLSPTRELAVQIQKVGFDDGHMKLVLF